MKTIFSLILLFAVNFCIAQEKCKYEKNETDPFTKTKVVITEWNDFANGIGIHGSIKMQLSDSLYLLYFSCAFNTGIQAPMTIEKDQQLLILLENEDTVMTTANETIKGSTKVESTGGGFAGKYYAEVHSNYTLNNDQIKKLTSSPLKSIRSYLKLGTGSIDKCTLTPNKKKKDCLINLINCVKNS